MLVTLWMSNKWVSTFPSFNELLKDEDMVDPRLELSHGVVNSGDGHSYRRSHSATELSMATQKLAKDEIVGAGSAMVLGGSGASQKREDKR